MPRPFSEDKKQEWKRIIGQWESSTPKVSAAHFCRQQSIDYSNFLYWRQRFQETRLKRSSFRELPCESSKASIILEHNQVRIQITEHFDPATLKKCLQVLKGL